MSVQVQAAGLDCTAPLADVDVVAADKERDVVDGEVDVEVGEEVDGVEVSA